MRFTCLAWLLIAAAGTVFAQAGPDVAFLAAEQARAAIIDESVEPYFSLLQTQEMSAKTGSAIDGGTLAEQRDACRKRFQEGVGEFSAAEQTVLRRVVAGVHPLLAKRYPVFAAEPWRFIRIANQIEGGMPHTRGHCIVLSDAVMPMFIAGDAQPSNPAGTELLVHEQCHVLQRLHPQLFAPLYVESWGMVPMALAPSPTGELIKHQLVNPDGIACVWAFAVTRDGASELIQPQVLLGGDTAVPRMPDDFQLVALTVEKRGDGYDYVRGPDGQPRAAPLESIAAYGEAFAPSEENFHPNEICAELFSRLVTLDLLGSPEHESPCQQGLRGWAASYLGSTAADVVHPPLPRMAPVPPRKVGAAPPGANEIVYVLGRGETLTATARKFSVTVEWLIKRNAIVDLAAVKEGLPLVVPRPAAANAP